MRNEKMFRAPFLTPRRVWLAFLVAVAADGFQVLLGPLGWAFFDEVIDVLTMIATCLLIGFHPLLLPTFIVEFIPVGDIGRNEKRRHEQEHSAHHGKVAAGASVFHGVRLCLRRSELRNKFEAEINERRGIRALPRLVASGVPPDVEGGILPPGRKAWTFLRLVASSANAVSKHFVRRARRPAYGRPEARRYGGSAEMRLPGTALWKTLAGVHVICPNPERDGKKQNQHGG